MKDQMCAVVLTDGIGDRQDHSGAADLILYRPAAEWVFCALQQAGIDKVAAMPQAFTGATDTLVELRDIADFAYGYNTIFVISGAVPLLSVESIQKAIAAHRQAEGGVTLLLSDDTPLAALVDRDELGLLIEARGLLGLASLPNSYSMQCPDQEGKYILDKASLFDINTVARTLVLRRLLESGVEITDASGITVAPDATIGAGTVLHKGVIIKQGCVIGKDCDIGPDSMLEHAILGNQVVVNASQIEYSKVGSKTKIGPFSHIRPDSTLAEGVKIGNFVEVKNSNIGERTSVAHLTYLGDTDCGGHVNWGCGCVTVNYDGKGKHRTIVGDNVFVGCNTNLVAPVKVEGESYIAAGSTITKTVPKHALAIARAPQVNKEGWTKKREEKNK